MFHDIAVAAFFVLSFTALYVFLPLFFGNDKHSEELKQAGMAKAKTLVGRYMVVSKVTEPDNYLAPVFITLVRKGWRIHANTILPLKFPCKHVSHLVASDLLAGDKVCLKFSQTAGEKVKANLDGLSWDSPERYLEVVESR